MVLRYIILLFTFLIIFAVTGNCKIGKHQTSTLIIEYDKNIHAKYLDQVKFYPPIGGKFYNQRISLDGSIDSIKQQIHLSFEQELPCFFSVKYGNSSLEGYIEPGETIVARLPSNEPFRFIGTRSNENNLYNSTFSSKRIEETYTNIKQKLNESSKENIGSVITFAPWEKKKSTLKEYVDTEWKVIIQGYLNLLNEKKITSTAFEAFSIALHTEFYRKTLVLLAELSLAERNNSLDKLSSVIFKDNIASSPLLVLVPSGDVLLTAFVNYRSNKDSLSSMDDEFKVFGKYVHYNFLTTLQQEYMLGNAFYLQKRWSTFDRDFNTKKAFQEYKKRYLNSPFTPIISKIHEEAFGEIQIIYKLTSQKSSINRLEKATLIDFSGNHMIIDTAVAVKSLHGLLSKYTPATSAYLDFWATWCAPCLSEFDHSVSTKKLMDGNGVKMIYISLDKPENKNAWINIIKFKKLRGIHILASEMLDKDLREVYEITSIPRYMLIDKDGNFKSKNAPRPSQLRDLIMEVNQL